MGTTRSAVTSLDGVNLHDSQLLSVAIHGAPEGAVTIEMDYILSYESMTSARARLRFEGVAIADVALHTWLGHPDSIDTGNTLNLDATRQLLVSRGMPYAVDAGLCGHEITTSTGGGRVLIACRSVLLEIDD